MKFELFVALRYLKARRKQAVISVISLISVLGVAAGVTALIVALSLNAGFQQEFQRRILGVTAHLNVLGALGSNVQDFRETAQRLNDIPGVVSVTPTIYGQGLIQSELRQQPVIVKGVESSDRGPLSQVLEHIVEGNVRDFGAKGTVDPLLLGKDLATALAVSAGDQVRVFGLQGELSPLGVMPRAQNFRVVAVFESGLWEYDANWALIPLGSAQKFFRMPSGEVSALEVRLADIYSAPAIARDFRERLGSRYTTSTWIELNKPLFSALRLEKLAMFMAIGLIVLVACLNIVSTLTLMVMEKSRDIAIITAMGGTPQMITRVFMLQGLMIGVVGTILGDLLGTVGVWYLDTHKVIRLEPQVYSIPYVPFHLDPSDVIVVSLVAVVISFLSTLYPARAAASLDPVEAIRYE